MSVRPTQIENPERDLALTTREAKPKDEAAELRARIKQAATVRPGPELHWWEMWRQGRDAAVAAASELGVAAVRALAPPRSVGCRDCWEKGRVAALRVIEGG